MQNMAGGMVYFNGSQRWGSDELVSMFVPVTTLVDVSAITTDLVQYVGVSLATCARLCAYSNVSSTREIAPGLVVYDTLVCQAFLYNTLIRTCQLSGTLLTADASVSSPSAVWSLYTKNTPWIASPLLLNMLGGVVTARVGVSASINLAVFSNGSVTVPAGASMSFGYQFSQGSHGRLTVQGTLTLAQSSLLGNATGTGTLAFTASNDTVASDSSVLIGNGQHTIDASLAAPALTMLVRGSGAMVNFGRHAQSVVLRNLLVSAGTVQVMGAGFHLSLSGNLRVYNHGTFKTVSQILSNDQCTGGASICYDVLVTVAGTMAISAGGRVDVSLAIFNASSISVGDGSVVSCTARGYSSSSPGKRTSSAGTYAYLGSSGGSHAGLGGVGNSQTGFYVGSLLGPANDTRSAYGNFYSSFNWGAPGGGGYTGDNNTPELSYGGGALRLTALTVLAVNGSISCDGSTAVNSLAGGGAGGSLQIVCNTLEGHGTISAHGGAGGRYSNNYNNTPHNSQQQLGQGGGGGGGRISLTTAFNFSHSYVALGGTFLARGGIGYQSGAAGTVYQYQANLHRSGWSILTVENAGRHSFLPTVISSVPDPRRGGVLDQLTVLAGAYVTLSLPRGTFFPVLSLTGDYSGHVALTNGSVLSANGTLVTTTDDFHAFVPRSYLRISRLTLTVADGQIDHTDLHIGNGGKVYLTEAGSTTSNTFHTSAVGQYAFSFVQLEANATLVFDYSSNLVSNKLRKKVRPSRPGVSLITGVLKVATGGHIHSDGQGYAGSAAGNRSVSLGQDPIAVGAGGRGLGRFGASGGGGGAYGGVGGVGFSATGGSSYGDVSNPSDLGSGGGGAMSSIAGDAAAIYREASVVWNENEQGLRQRVALSAMVTAVGGNGGGLVRIKATSVILNGTISADGMPGTYPGAGGGSGGTVLIDTKSMIGPGSISANGGYGLFSSAFFGGGGSGGRIKIICRYCRRAGGYFNQLDVARQRFSDSSLIYINSYIDPEGTTIITLSATSSPLIPDCQYHNVIALLIHL